VVRKIGFGADDKIAMGELRDPKPLGAELMLGLLDRGLPG
jgi:hypothetical protein